MKKMLVAALISFPIFVAFFFGLDYRSRHPLKFPLVSFSLNRRFVNRIRRPWNDFVDEWERRHDGIPAALPSPTSYPRLAENQANARLADLFQSNGGCRFPCWWGFDPGRTGWQTVHAELSSFMDSGTMQHLRDEGDIFTNGYYYDIASRLSIDVGVNPDGSVSETLIADIPPEYLSNLSIGPIFQTYGMPDAIYVRSPYKEVGAYRSCVGMFELFLFYPAR